MVKECDIEFDAHMSGFVYKIRVGDQVMVKKEVPGAEVVEEFLYEIHALHSLQYSDHVIGFRGLVTDDDNEVVKALLLDYCASGTLMDRIYDDCKTTYLGIPWRKRERWARQIIRGLADLHESGFVQGDLTLANVVLDEKENAKIIDVNRRGCPVGWEPPESKALVATGQRLSLYIGVKSDLFQLGMVLWALAMEEDEPEIQGRPLLLGPEVNIPDWYRQITEICLSHDPRSRLMASQLLTMIPDPSFAPAYSRIASRPAVERSHSPRELPAESASNAAANGDTKNEATFFPQRGRSPPSPMPSDSSRQQKTGWAANIPVAASYDDMAAKAKRYLDASRNRNSMPTPESDTLTQKQQPTKLAPPRSHGTDRSFRDDASRASATPPAPFAAVPTLPKQPTTYLNSTDSGICMRSHSEETVAYPSISSTSPPHNLTKRINNELFEDLERNGAAKSALDAIFGLNKDDRSAKSQTTAQLDDASAMSQYTSRSPDDAFNLPRTLDDASAIPQFTSRPSDGAFNLPGTTVRLDNVASMPPPPMRLDSNGSTIPIFTAQRADNPSNMPQYTVRLDSNASISLPLTTQQAEHASNMPEPTLRRESNSSASQQFSTQRSHNVSNMPQATAPSEMSQITSQFGNNAATTPRMTSPRDNHAAIIPHSAAQLDDNVSTTRRFATQSDATIAQFTANRNVNVSTTPQSTAHLDNASVSPQTTTRLDKNASTSTQSSPKQERNATTTRQATTPLGNISTAPQTTAQRVGNPYIGPQTAMQPGDTSTIPGASAQLDDNASVASCISRTSSPDGDLEGGAQLGRSETAFSVVDTHFTRPEYPAASKLPLTTVIDTPIATVNQHPTQKPNSNLPSLRPGQSIPAPLLADLNPDIHFDSALWPDATRRFMTGAKS